MDSRWLFGGFGAIFGALAVAFASRGDLLPAGIAALQTALCLGGLWWNTTREEPIETRLGRLR